MVRIKVNILKHDGKSQIEKVWKCLNKCHTYVYKTIQTAKAVYLVTDCDQMDKLMTKESKKVFQNQGFDIVTPQEYITERTTIIKGVDEFIMTRTDEEILADIAKTYQNKKAQKRIEHT